MEIDIRKHANEDGYCYWIIRALIFHNYTQNPFRPLRRTEVSSFTEEYYNFENQNWYELGRGDDILQWSTAHIISKEEAIIYMLTRRLPSIIVHE